MNNHPNDGSTDGVQVVLPSLFDGRLFMSLQALIRGETLLVTSIIDPLVATTAARVAADVAVTDYGVAPGFAFQADAPPLFEARTSADVMHYVERGAEYERNFATRMRPLPTPAAIVERALELAWPSGIKRLQMQGQRAPFGVVRHLQPGARVLPHTDNSDLDRPEIDVFARARTNLSVLVYLQPSQGGELVIYNKKLTTKAQINALRLVDHPYALDRAFLPKPGVILAPAAGLVAIFDAKNVHEVLLNTGLEPRVSVSGFLLVSETTTPIISYY